MGTNSEMEVELLWDMLMIPHKKGLLVWQNRCFDMAFGVRGLVNCYIANWKDPPCYSWENPLFRLGQFQ